MSDKENKPTQEKELKEDSFLHTFLAFKEVRYNALTFDQSIGKSVHGNDPWLKTVFVIKERALDTFVTPWIITSLNSIVWTVLIHVKPFKDRLGNEVVLDIEEEWRTFFSLVLTTTMAFLLVFRLNRVAIRWWDTRRMWGVIIAQCRMLASSILIHTNHDPKHRDNAIKWLLTYPIAVKQHLRSELEFKNEELAGILSTTEIQSIADSNHLCLYAATEIRHSLYLAFKVAPETVIVDAYSHNSVMRMYEKSIDMLIDQMGGLERVRATPLPIVYVTHLRTFLMIYLLSLPYFYGHSLGWGTIPAIIMSSYALLGIDGAAAECESPFRKGRPNHLDMEKFCTIVFNDIEQLLVHNEQLRAKE